MYELVIWITVGIVAATIFSGAAVINRMLTERGHKPIEIPEEWWT